MTAVICDQSFVTPLGAHPAMLASAIAAGMSGFQHSDLFGEQTPVTFAPVPQAVLDVPLKAPFPGMSPPHIRLLKIAAFALADLTPRLPDTSVPLLLAGPEQYYPQNRVSPPFIQHLINATGLKLDRRNSRYFAEGRAGGLRALGAAMELLAQGDVPYVLVGGIDTFCDARTLSGLKKQWRLLGDASIGGMVPGEGAGFLLLKASGPSEANVGQFVLAPPQFGFEQGHLFSSQPYTAETLANVLRQAVKTLATPAASLYSSENGEHHYQRELTLARLRHKGAFTPDHKLVRLAEHVGDLGAAFAPVALALAASEPEPSGPTVVCASSDSGPRAVVWGYPGHQYPSSDQPSSDEKGT
ncbi:beta-ketoacyl synthase N-terminal-like domain-containing protein [Marinimicrobium locisalis]|uniref:beta-ketoacyl synthase N-terminal-like domain-containing protein n=1 Tax=Marinimicrobium locisalis TaxID=546022 RepID=UPI00322207F3